MNKFKYLLLFILINFGGLALGSWLMNGESTGEWYTQLNKAPWTPLGWVFGAAWTLIMVCFSIWCAKAFEQIKSSKLTIVFITSLLLNVSWNYVFFNQHSTILGLVVIVGLLFSILYLLANIKPKPKSLQFLLFPYIIWLCIAISLNAYIVLNN